MLASIRCFKFSIAFALTLSLASACVSTRNTPGISSASGPSGGPTPTVGRTSPAIPVVVTEIKVVAPRDGWELGRISWLAAGPDGLIYLLHRGTKADPVVVLDARGQVVNSWGSGLYSLPHSLRVDPEGNIWTTDAASSRVIKFSPEGTKLLEIEVGGQPADCVQNQERRGFCGTSDLAWGPDGHVFVADGYGNARIVEYTTDGQKVREWGKRGTGPGEFNLPHSIAITDGVVYVADRENARVQRFDLEGRWLGEWKTDGNPYTLTVGSDAIWLDLLRRVEQGASRRPARLVKADRASGRVLGFIDPPGGHGTAITTDGKALLVPAGDKLYRVDLHPQRTR